MNDVVLDPFGGIGTTAKAALKLDRRFCTDERADEYIEATLSDLYQENRSGRLCLFQYRDLSGESDSPECVSFDHFLHKLLREGHTKEELYRALKKGLEQFSEDKEQFRKEDPGCGG